MLHSYKSTLTETVVIHKPVLSNITLFHSFPQVIVAYNNNHLTFYNYKFFDNKQDIYKSYVLL